MPEFKAPIPEPKPLACTYHGNDPQCPGYPVCTGVIQPSPADYAQAAADAKLRDAAALLAEDAAKAK